MTDKQCVQPSNITQTKTHRHKLEANHTRSYATKAGPEVIKLFPCSTQLNTKLIQLINVKMPTIVGILTFISVINATSESLKATHFLICRYFSFYEQLKVRA